MGTSELFDTYFQQVAKQAAQNKTTPTPSSTGVPSSSLLKQDSLTPITSGRESDWSLGQGIIDFLSTGSYYTAGAGRTTGEGIKAFQQGDILGGLSKINPISGIAGGIQGIQEKRTWSQNLEDLGVSEADSAGWGLALDIALDPLWLIPGGAIASGVKGTTRGAVTAARVNKAGIQLSPEAIRVAGQRLVEGRKGLPPATTKDMVQLSSPLRNVVSQNQAITDLFPKGQKISALSGTGVKNLYQGIKQGNIENYAEWATLRKIEKANKAIRKDTKMDTTAYSERFEQKFKIDPQTLLFGTAPAAAKAVDDVIQGTTRAAEKPTFEADIPDATSEASEAIKKSVDIETDSRVVDDLQKDASAAVEAADNVIDEAGAAATKSVNARAREELGPARANYMESRNLGKPGLAVEALAKIKTSPIAGDIAQAYERMVSDPTNPEVIAAYSKLSEEVEDQFRYMTDELGINVKFVDENPYQVKNADGEDVTDSKLFMEDILNNKQLLVYKTAEEQVHPIMSKDMNDKFRAVHDFFGHAASGRGVWADGEEAAWVSHSLMFSPLARRAMTTETRGQNSWVNKYGVDPETGKYTGKYAEQKAGLLPDAYVLLPDEYSAIENQIVATNSLIGRSANIFQEMSDNILADAGMIVQPVRGYQYTKETFAKIQKARDEITDSQLVKVGSPDHTLVVKGLQALRDRVAKGTRPGAIAEDLIALAANLPGDAATAIKRVLNEPTDATDLLLSAAKAEGRTLDTPPPFKPISWEPKAGYAKPGFSAADLERYFPGDPLLSDPKLLDIAMGAAPATAVRAMRGETKQQALARKQSRIWEDFRARNETFIKDAEEAQKLNWNAKYNNPDSDLFLKIKQEPFGVGKLPLGIPRSSITSMNGKPMIIMAKFLESIGSTTIVEPNRRTPGLGSLEPMIMASIRKGQRVSAGDSELSPMFEADEVIQFASSKMTGAKFKVVDADGNDFKIVNKNGKVSGITTEILKDKGLPAGAKLLPDGKEAEQLFAVLNKLGRDMQITRIPDEIKDWASKKLDDAARVVSNQNVRISRSIADTDTLVAQLRAAVPEIISDSHARLFVANLDNAVKQLEKLPKKQIFVKQDELLPMRGEAKSKIARDPNSGVPLPGGEKYAREVFGVADEDYTLLAKTGSQFTGRVPTDKVPGRDKLNRPMQSQLGNSPQKLAALANVEKAITTLTGAITSKQLQASPEQAVLLSNILRQLGKEVAPNASPQAVFKQFQKDAKMAFEDVIKNIESAAKREAVLAAAPRAFSKSVEENMALLEAIEKTDPGAVQRKVIQFTEDAVSQVNDSCRALDAVKRSAPTEFLENISIGGSGGF
jgi:hypothetical protein